MSAEVMAPPLAAREVLATLSTLLRYPDVSFSTSIDRVVNDLRGWEKGRQSIGSFAGEFGMLETVEQQSLYTSTFDLAPVCSPYLGVHLFGDESRDRARLMSGLQMTYHKHGVSLQGRELPDHIAEVLTFATAFGEQEWADLVQLILRPALVSMEERLGDPPNPFRHLFAAVRQSFAEGPGERRES